MIYWNMVFVFCFFFGKSYFELCHEVGSNGNMVINVGFDSMPYMTKCMTKDDLIFVISSDDFRLIK